jgi:hypothetical protein
MPSLRWIELEIEDEDVSRDTKLSFCQELASVLNERRDREDNWMGDVRVIFVERVLIEKIKEKEFVYYGGLPGDAYESGETLIA